MPLGTPIAVLIQPDFSGDSCRVHENQQIGRAEFGRRVACAAGSVRQRATTRDQDRPCRAFQWRLCRFRHLDEAWRGTGHQGDQRPRRLRGTQVRGRRQGRQEHAGRCARCRAGTDQGRRGRHHRLLQHRQRDEGAGRVPEEQGAAAGALRDRIADHQEIPHRRKLHLPVVRHRQPAGALCRQRCRQARLDEDRHFCRHHRLRRGGVQ